MYPQTLSLFWILQSVFSNSELSESVTQSGHRSATAADKGVGYYSKQVVRDVVQTWQLRSWQLYCISFFRIDGRAYCFGECWFWTNGNKQDVCVTMLCSKSILWRPWKWAWIQCVAVCSNATWIEYLLYSACAVLESLLIFVHPSSNITETFWKCVTWVHRAADPIFSWSLLDQIFILRRRFRKVWHERVRLERHLPHEHLRISITRLLNTCMFPSRTTSLVFREY